MIDEAIKVAVNEDVLPVEGLYCDLYTNTPPQKVRATTETIVQPYTTSEALLKKLGREAKKYC